MDEKAKAPMFRSELVNRLDEILAVPEGPFRFNKVQSPRRDVAGSPIVEDMDGPLMHATDAPFDLVADRDSTHINVVARMGVDFRPDVAANPLTRACSTIRLSGGGSRVETKLQR